MLSLYFKKQLDFYLYKVYKIFQKKSPTKFASIALLNT